MDGRAFLDVARRTVKGATEADWRDAAGRAYYALLLECRTTLRQWGCPIPRRDQVHAFVRLRFSFAADSDLKNIGFALNRLGQLRNEADYQTDAPGKFKSAKEAQRAIRDAEQAIALLDQIEVDAIRRTAAIAAIQATLPPTP